MRAIHGNIQIVQLMDPGKGFSLFLLDVNGEINPSRGRQRFYALSCITSPGGKHRGLAGSVAVLIAESLLMLTSPYIRVVATSISFAHIFVTTFSQGV
jgi:hypothetical protein